MARNFAAAALVVALSTTATAQVAILQIQVTGGEGEVHAPGSRSARPLTVEVTDEMGRPVPGTAVSFHLPEDGPSGQFANGLRTEVVTADERGRASARGLRCNSVAGRFQIRIFASKEQARAGIVSFQYITGRESTALASGSAPPRSGPAPKATSRRPWWIAAIALAGGGAAAGMLAARRRTDSGTAAAAAVLAPAPTIGQPAISVGKP